MARDIQGRAREVLGSDTARAIAATAVGEAIRRGGATRQRASEGVLNARASTAGAFAAGAGVATVAQVGARRIAKLITSRKRTPLFKQSAAKVATVAGKSVQAPRDAVDAFTSKLGRSSGGSRTPDGTTPSKPTPTRPKRVGANSGQTARPVGKRASKPSRSPSSSSSRAQRSAKAQSGQRSATTAKRGSSASSSRSPNGSSRSSAAKSSRNASGSSRSATARTSRNSNGNSAKKTRAKSAARPATSRRS